MWEMSLHTCAETKRGGSRKSTSSESHCPQIVDNLRSEPFLPVREIEATSVAGKETRVMPRRIRIPIKVTTRIETRYRVETRLVSRSTSSRIEPRQQISVTCPDCGHPNNGSLPITATDFACGGCGTL